MSRPDLYPSARPIPAWRALLFSLFLGTVGTVLPGCDDQAATVATHAVPVHIVIARPDPESAGFSLPGTLVPRVESPLAFRVPGRIVRRLTDVGATVAQGDTLARLDDTTYKLAVQEAQAALIQAKATREQVRRDVMRNRALARTGAIAGREFEALEIRHTQAKAEVQAARSRLERARHDLDHATLTAPSAGAIAAVLAEEGQVVAAGTPVLRLARGGEQEVQIDVPESRIAEISRSGTATVRLLTLPDVVLSGTVREVASVADAATHTYRVRLSLQELPEKARLGMTASVRFQGAVGTHLQLPISALFHQGEQPAVWVLPSGATQLELRPITLAAMDTDTITVASGIAPGERVVSSGVHRLDANVAVQAWDGRLP